TRDPPARRGGRQLQREVEAALVRACAAVSALVGELVRRAEELVGQPLARLRTRDRVEQEAERYPGQQERRIPRAVLLLALDAVCRLAQLVDGLPQPLLDVLVGRHARREGNRAAAADQLVVNLPCGLEG